MNREVNNIEGDAFSGQDDHYVTGGFTLFFVMSYILIANPLILSCAQSSIRGCVGMPPGAVFFGTALAAGLFSIAAGVVTRMPAAIAPGMAFNIYFVQFLSQNHIPWSAGLILCSLAAFFVLLLSVTGYRYRMVRSIPIPLARAMGGGIGALLAETAINYLRKPGSEDFEPVRILLFLVGIAVISPLYFYGRDRARKSSRLSSLQKRILDVIGCSSFILSILLIWACSLLPILHLQSPAVGTHIYYLWSIPPKISYLKSVFDPAAFPFVLFLMYMLTIDIVGSPYELVRQLRTDRQLATDHRRVSTLGFLVDSIANIIAPILGTSPVVFFAENHSARLVGARGGGASIIAGVLFLIVALVGFALSFKGLTLSLPPTIAIAPTLFVVGAIVVAETLEHHAIGVSRPKANSEIGAIFQDSSKLFESFPAAVTIVLTPLVGIQFGLAGGIMAFCALLPLLSKERRAKELVDREAFSLLVFIALLAMAWMGWLTAQRLVNSV